MLPLLPVELVLQIFEYNLDPALLRLSSSIHAVLVCSLYRSPRLSSPRSLFLFARTISSPSNTAHLAPLIRSLWISFTGTCNSNAPSATDAESLSPLLPLLSILHPYNSLHFLALLSLPLLSLPPQTWSSLQPLFPPHLTLGPDHPLLSSSLIPSSLTHLTSLSTSLLHVELSHLASIPHLQFFEWHISGAKGVARKCDLVSKLRILLQSHSLREIKIVYEDMKLLERIGLNRSVLKFLDGRKIEFVHVKKTPYSMIIKGEQGSEQWIEDMFLEWKCKLPFKRHAILYNHRLET